MCGVTGAVSVPRKEMKHVSVRGWGSAIPWSRQGYGQGRGRYYGQAVEGRDEEEEGEKIVGLTGSCMSCCLKTVLCRRGMVPAG